MVDKKVNQMTPITSHSLPEFYFKAVHKNFDVSKALLSMVFLWFPAVNKI
jgi:hypothetical protein